MVSTSIGAQPQIPRLMVERSAGQGDAGVEVEGVLRLNRIHDHSQGIAGPVEISLQVALHDGVIRAGSVDGGEVVLQERDGRTVLEDQSLAGLLIERGRGAGQVAY